MREQQEVQSLQSCDLDPQTREQSHYSTHPDIPSTDRKSPCSLGGFESPTIQIHLEGCFPINPLGWILKEWRYQRLMERANFPFSLEHVSYDKQNEKLMSEKVHW